jgi:hypothetical protein
MDYRAVGEEKKSNRSKMPPAGAAVDCRDMADYRIVCVNTEHLHAGVIFGIRKPKATVGSDGKPLIRGANTSAI